MSDDKKTDDKAAMVAAHEASATPPKTDPAATQTQDKPEGVLDKLRNVGKPKSDNNGDVPAQFAMPAQTESEDPWGDLPVQMRVDDEGKPLSK